MFCAWRTCAPRCLFPYISSIPTQPTLPPVFGCCVNARAARVTPDPASRRVSPLLPLLLFPAHLRLLLQSGLLSFTEPRPSGLLDAAMSAAVARYSSWHRLFPALCRPITMHRPLVGAGADGLNLCQHPP